MQKLSFVFTARNDNYGGNLVRRATLFLTTIGDLCARHNLDAEVVLVEYNPEPDKPALGDILRQEHHRFLFRTITVPHEFHSQFPRSERIPMFEYIAKNIGIKRAKGEYIVSINPDIILSDEVFAYITSDQITKKAFYRANRHDLQVKDLPDHQTLDERLAYCKNSTVRIWENNHLRYTSWKRWAQRVLNGKSLTGTIHSLALAPILGKLLRPAGFHIHDSAAGDFLMTHRENWDTVGGHDESPLSSFMDGYVLGMMRCAGLQQVIMKGPIFHINHDFGKGGRPEVAFSEYTRNMNSMIQTHTYYKTPNPSWGFPEEEFVEQSS